MRGCLPNPIPQCKPLSDCVKLPKPKIYLAARFDRQEEMRYVRRKLEKYGFTVTSRWLDERPGADPSMCACIDVADIKDADLLIRFSDSLNGATVPSRYATGGRMFESGLAWALGKPILVVD